MELLLDTNIYTEIVKDDNEGTDLVKSILEDKNFIIHSFRIIRDELRNTPSKIEHGNKQLRMKLLEIHDRITKGKRILETEEMINLAGEYYEEYKNQGGGLGKEAIIKDFKIVACASIKNMDLVVSNDESSLKCNNALNSYKIINMKKNLRTPTFYSYELLKISKL